MKRFTIEQMQVYSGEWIEIRFTEAGKALCPVCGYLWPDCRPYYEGIPEGAGSEPARPFAFPSQDICPCCSTHFGFDDYTEEPGKTIKSIWAERRRLWLAECKDMEKARLQLREIGTELDPASGGLAK